MNHRAWQMFVYNANAFATFTIFCEFKCYEPQSPKYVFILLLITMCRQRLPLTVWGTLSLSPRNLTLPLRKVKTETRLILYVAVFNSTSGNSDLYGCESWLCTPSEGRENSVEENVWTWGGTRNSRLEEIVRWRTLFIYILQIKEEYVGGSCSSHKYAYKVLKGKRYILVCMS